MNILIIFLVVIVASLLAYAFEYTTIKRVKEFYRLAEKIEEDTESINSLANKYKILADEIINKISNHESSKNELDDQIDLLVAYAGSEEKIEDSVDEEISTYAVLLENSIQAKVLANSSLLFSGGVATRRVSNSSFCKVLGQDVNSVWNDDLKTLRTIIEANHLKHDDLVGLPHQRGLVYSHQEKATLRHVGIKTQGVTTRVLPLGNKLVGNVA